MSEIPASNHPQVDPYGATPISDDTSTSEQVAENANGSNDDVEEAQPPSNTISTYTNPSPDNANPTNF